MYLRENLPRTGMSTAKIEKAVTGWLATHKQPGLKIIYSESVYLPRFKLLSYFTSDWFNMNPIGVARSVPA
jgi:hypothetical protein